MNKIAVSILGQDNKVKLVNKLITSGFKTIHYDIMDGQFVANVSMPQPEMDTILRNVTKHNINLHFMVLDPLKYIQIYQDRATFMTFHYEALSRFKISELARRYGRKYKLGIAINPETNVEQVYEFLPFLTHVLVMSVVPGQGGQKFKPEALVKIKKLREYITKHRLDCFIQVDGGINDITGPLCFIAGADIVVSGSFLLSNLHDKKISAKITKT